MSVVIKAENLGKKYVISHNTNTAGNYSTFRESIANKVKSFGNVFKPNKQLEMGRKEEFWALKDIDFDIKDGDRVGIIGRNGAGKSTLLKVLSRITNPSTGSVKTRGRIASLLEVGTGFHPELTGRENIYMNGAILGMSKVDIKRKFDEIVAFAEIEKFLDTPVKRYSSGMYVRLAFAVAAHLEPEILIVDEVLAVGDANFQKKCLGKMESVSHNEGRTVLFVSHNMTAIKQLCKRAIILKNGNLIYDGSSHDAVSQYLNNNSNSLVHNEWDKNGPCNENVELISITLGNKNKQPINEIYTDNDLTVNIKFRTKNENVYVGLTLLLYNDDGHIVFSSINNHEKEWYNKSMPKAEFDSVCNIPGNLLNDGWHSFSIIMFGQNYSDAVTINEVLNFEVFDGTNVRGDYFGEWAGVIRPFLNWETKKL